MEQTVTEAAAAAAPQQQTTIQQGQQLVSQPLRPIHPVQSASLTIDNLICQWQGCGERCDGADALYASLPALFYDMLIVARIVLEPIACGKIVPSRKIDR
jgi:hypothetical protein